MTRGWRIREAGLGDISALTALETSAFGADGWGGNAVAEGLTAAFVTTLLIYGPDDESPCGFALWRRLGGEAEILSIGVAPDSRRKGAAKALLRAIAEGASAAGGDRLFLEVNAGNAAALALYADSGFEQISLRKRYYKDGGDAVVMRIRL